MLAGWVDASKGFRRNATTTAEDKIIRPAAARLAGRGLELLAVSVPVTIWVEKLPYRSIEIPNTRPRGRQMKPLSFAHREVLLVLARHARHNGLAWPGMPTIAEKAGVSDGQARRLISDLKRARLIKVHEGGGRGHSNFYWVANPWTAEPESVLELPKLPNDQFPSEARLKPGGAQIDVDYYVRAATIRSVETPAPVQGFNDEERGSAQNSAHESCMTHASPMDGQTPAPVLGNEGETPAPVHPNRAETPAPVQGESPSFVETSSIVEDASGFARARAAAAAGDDGRSLNGDARRSPNGHQLSLSGTAALPMPALDPHEDESWANFFWGRALELLREHPGVTPIQFDRYLAGTRGVSYHHLRLLLVVEMAHPMDFHWLEANLAGPIAEAIGVAADAPILVEWQAPPPAVVGEQPPGRRPRPKQAAVGA